VQATCREWQSWRLKTEKREKMADCREKALTLQRQSRETRTIEIKKSKKTWRTSKTS
jgi:hypothetical protein